jgi:hypothetical protein
MYKYVIKCTVLHIKTTKNQRGYTGFYAKYKFIECV